jgi:peptidoglycan hydrolase CwlO-like protein
MRVLFPDIAQAPPRRAALLAALLVAACCVLTAFAVRAPGETLQGKLQERHAELGRVQDRQGDVEAQIESFNSQIDALLGQVASLQSQRAALQSRLVLKQQELKEASAALARQRDRLKALRGHLRRSLGVLRERLVAIYMAGSPDTINVVLGSDTWSGLVSQTEYLEQVQDYDDAVIGRVKSLRDEARNAVSRLRGLRDRIRAARDAIAAQESELASTEASLQAQRSELAAAQGARQQLLDSLAGQEDALQGSISSLNEQLQAQAAPEPSTSGVAPAPQPVPGSAAQLLPDGTAAPPADAPAAVQAVIEAANQIADTPYIWGGGHGSFDSPGYDCSGSVSFALHGGGFLDSPLDSTGLEFWGEPGSGSWITVYANAGHAWAVIAGLRWDTSGGAGPRWHTDMASTAGFVARHPSGY